jgi:hypothetical protein
MISIKIERLCDSRVGAVGSHQVTSSDHPRASAIFKPNGHADL